MTMTTDLKAASLVDDLHGRLLRRQHPDLRYIVLRRQGRGGQDGHGRHERRPPGAKAGKRTLLASTNPVHCLSGLLGQDVFGKPTAVNGVDNLWAYEIDTRDAIERSKREIREKIQWFLKFAEISTKADEFVEAATMNPAFEESAMFENMIDLMFKDEYDVYVFDTAPTANARRLLGMSKVYGLWVEKMLKSREEAQSLRESLSFTKKKEEDPLMLYLVDFRERIRHARELLTDPAKTAFFFVTLPEALPIAVIRRFIDWFTDFGIPVGGVVVNMVIRPGGGRGRARTSCATGSRCRPATSTRSGSAFHGPGARRRAAVRLGPAWGRQPPTGRGRPVRLRPVGLAP